MPDVGFYIYGGLYIYSEPFSTEMNVKATLYDADTRGKSDIGWLKSNFSFSFAHYHDPKRMHFGMLRVLNDDHIEPAQGFGTHPHNDMEIITIPLSGVLTHRDSMGHEATLGVGRVQVMSAGTGLTHSEYNASPDTALTLLQLWIFPERRGLEPRYDEAEISELSHNTFHAVVGPPNGNASVYINQDAWLSLARLDAKSTTPYTLHNRDHGAFVFVIEGDVSVSGVDRSRRDAVGITEAESLDFEAKSDAYVLVIEVPMLPAA